MLVLQRRQGESVLIGDGIRVVVVRIDRDKVRLGFVAPAELRVDREEVRERIERGRLPGPIPGEWKETEE